jgi:hypothetical protein
MNRRTFLKCLGVAGAGLAGFGRSVADARVPIEPVTILVLDFTGGWNVHASFAARTSASVNPNGIFRDGDLGAITASNVLFRDRDQIVNLQSNAWGMRIPGFEDAARDYSIIGAMRHSTAYALDDHGGAAQFAGTGYLDTNESPGLGTVIGRHAPRGTNAPPAVVIDPGLASGEMARAPGKWRPDGPLVLRHRKLPVTGGGGVTWTRTEAALDEVARVPRRSLAREKIETLGRLEQAFHTYRTFLLDPAIDVLGDPDARYANGLLGKESPTTQQLLEAFGGSGYPDEGMMALAFRCIEGGSRFVAVGCSALNAGFGHDKHEAEDEAYEIYVHDAQIFAGVSFLLKKLGLSKRVLVVGLSEMARSTYSGASYNAAHGTDHGPIGMRTPKGMYGSNRQTVVIGHGPIVAGREVYPADPEYGDPLGAPCVTAELLAFLAECAGVEREDHPWAASPEGVPLSADVLAKGLVA